MTIEAHATAAGAGHPPAAELPPGALVNLAETIVIKEENVFVVCRRDSSLPVGAAHPLGVYSNDCRFLSGHELCVNGVRPRLLVASAAPGSESVHELTNPALPLPGGRLLPLQSIQLRLERRVLGDCELEETLLVHSYDREPLELELDLMLEADFEPMLAIRGIVAAGPARALRSSRAMRRPLRASAAATTATARRRSSPTATASRATARARSASGSRWRRAARRRSRCATSYTRATSRRPTGGGAAGAARRVRRTPDEWLGERTRVETDDELFNRVLRRSLLDMRMLHSRLGRRHLLRGRRALVRDAVRARLADRRHADAGLRPADGRADAARAGRADRDARRPGPRRGAGQGAARAARRRGRAARPVPARPLLRHRRRDVAVPQPALRPRRLERRPVAVRGAARRGRGDARLDRGPGDRDGDGLLEYSSRARPAPGCATRAGRTPTRACSTSTACRWSRRSR